VLAPPLAVAAAMIKRIVPALAVTGMLAASASLVHADTCPIAKQHGSLQSIVSTWVAQLQPGNAFGMCVVALDSAGNEGFACSGKADATHDLDKSSLFQIGSVTKTVTGALFARRMVEGTIGLDHRLDPYLPSDFQVGTLDQITMRELATHHSGLPRDPSEFNGADGDFGFLDGCLESEGCVGPNDYLYSNLGYQILGYTIAGKDGYDVDWFDDVYNNVLNLLTMEDTKNRETWVSDFSALFAAHATHKHTPDAAGTGFVDDGTSADSKCPTADPSGCLFSSSHDMRIWLQYVMGLDTPFTLYAEMRHLLRQSYDTAGTDERAGLGWRFNTGDVTVCDPVPSSSPTRYYTRVEKSGDVTGEHAFIAYLQDPANPDATSPLGVVVLANSDMLHGIDMGQRTYELLAALPMP
jgi:CubicO group peptidase (beta-lactamase class C family)